MLAAVAAAAGGPQRIELRNDALAELVRAGIGEREAGVRVQALERAGAGRGAADAELERGAAVAAGRAGRELLADAALRVVRLRTTRAELRVVVRRLRPAFDAARRLESRDRLHEVAARHVVRRRERHALRVVRALLGDRRPAERAAHGDAPERARLATDLARDELPISGHAATGYAGDAAATSGCP